MYKGINACFLWKVLWNMFRRDFLLNFFMFYLQLIDAENVLTTVWFRFRCIRNADVSSKDTPYLC